MDAKMEPQLILYDLASTKNVCFSPAVWRIRMMLNYKQIPYTTIFLEFLDIAPTLKEVTLSFIVDSALIAQFLESTYPSRPVPLRSSLGQRIEETSRSAIGPAFRTSVMPREINILSPRAQGYFRRTREAALGHALEDLITGEKEEEAWNGVAERIQAVDELICLNLEGPFVLGEKPNWTDFFLAGTLQSARMVHEKSFETFVAYPGFRGVYEACLPFMGKQD